MILAQLKEATKQQHDQLESTVNVMDQLFSLDDYKGLLIRFHRFYKAFEPKLPENELKAAGFDYSVRRKAPLLEADLRALNGTSLSNVDGFDGVPDVTTLSKAFGSLYVIEGSTLGGQVITRHLKQHLNLEVENGGTFFNSYGSNVGPMWRSFGEAITAFAASGENNDEIVQCARDTFESIRLCMSEPA
jgi:heme oxygenase